MWVNGVLLRGFAGILLAFLSFNLMGAADQDEFENKVWRSLEKAEIKLNENLPRVLIENLSIDKIEVNRNKKLVIYTGVVKNYNPDKSEGLSQEQNTQHAKNRTLTFICSVDETVRFLKILSIVDASVKYQFFHENRESKPKPFIDFIVSYDDCKARQNNGKVI